MSTITAHYTPAQRLTVKAHGAALTGGRFVMVAATKPTTGAAIPAKKPTGTTVSLLGVTAFDCLQDEHTQVFGAGHVVPVEVGATGVTAGDRLMVDTEGRVVPFVGDVAYTATPVRSCGLALTTTAAAGFALVRVNPA